MAYVYDQAKAEAGVLAGFKNDGTGKEIYVQSAKNMYEQACRFPIDEGTAHPKLYDKDSETWYLKVITNQRDQGPWETLPYSV